MKRILFFLFALLYLPLSGEYIHRYSALAERGGMTFTGNALGLSKKADENLAGISDAIGAYATVDTKESVGDFPFGTTLDYKKNSSAAILEIPSGSTILYAELIWGGSYGYDKPGTGEDPNKVLDPANGPIFFTTPTKETHSIVSDPLTRQHTQNSDPKIDFSAGNYTRSQDVTEIVKKAGGGTYTVGGVPSTISPLDNSHNAAGWTLAVIYRNPNLEIHNMSLFVGCEQSSSSTNEPAVVSGFLTPPEGKLSGRLLVCGIEGDANKSGDHMMFGPDLNSMSALSGPNNGEDNFFASQINRNDGELNTSGTFGDRNHHPPNRISAGRQGIDITNVDCSETLYHSQTIAYAQGVTNVGGEDFTISALGIQILVEAPVINPIKKVNGQDSIQSSVGTVVNISISMTNIGSVVANNVLLKDDLEYALIPVPGSCKVNGVSIKDPNYSEGIPIGDLPVNQTAVIDFQLKIEDFPLSRNTYRNIAKVEYQFQVQQSAFSRLFTSNLQDMNFENFSNFVSIVLPSPFAPTSFFGTLKKCKFLNKNEYSIRSYWTPPEEAGVLFYRIYDGDQVIGEIDADSSLVFNSCLVSKSQGKRLEIAAVYDNFAESVHVPIQILP